MCLQEAVIAYLKTPRGSAGQGKMNEYMNGHLCAHIG